VRAHDEKKPIVCQFVSFQTGMTFVTFPGISENISYISESYAAFQRKNLNFVTQISKIFTFTGTHTSKTA